MAPPEWRSRAAPDSFMISIRGDATNAKPL